MWGWLQAGLAGRTRPDRPIPQEPSKNQINFAAFAWLGISFSPRIKNIKTQWLYKIDGNKDYGNLTPFVAGTDHTIKMKYIVDNWDRMAQFYASLEEGHVTASTALKRIVGFTSKNHFYQANLQLGRILKTEHILSWMTDPRKRKRTRKGLLKVEQIHQLARDITYGNRGRLKGKTLEEITSSGNCTTLIMAAIIYWQAKEISKIVGSSRVSVELAHLDGVQPAKPAGSRPRFFSDQLVSSVTRHQPGWLHKNPRRTKL